MKPSPSPLSPTPAAAGRSAAWLGFAADTLFAIGLTLILSLAGGVIWALIAAARGLDMATPGVLVQMAMAVIATGGTAVLLYLLRRRASDAEKMASLQAIYRSSTWGWTLLAGAAVFLGSSLVSWLFAQFTDQPTPSNMALMEQARAQYPLLLVLFAVGLAPFYEELLFRRVLFGRLAAAGMVLPGIVLSSLLFALSHEIPGLGDHGWAAMLQLWLVYGGMGAVFAWLYQRTGTLLAPIVAHAINNGVALTMLMLGLSAS
ncbi:CPBP family intramembrane glutamic endopeptidase [Stenotrophomonas ginsengisoli]|uniref:CPBP family intramembrane glutamic endopeptidase n=1 Tax=Stenotrophomonas ginsengisoli TaxID=336566 RepID=UPI0007106063|nr:type II CAAX endopeptidase family protein [Stenotrophomonas ginsengisoli]